MDAATARRAIEAIDRNARNQARLVEDVLDVSRIVSGKLRLDIQPTEVASVVWAAVDVVRPAAEAKRIDFRLALGDACVISADAATAPAGRLESRQQRREVHARGRADRPFGAADPGDGHD